MFALPRLRLPTRPHHPPHPPLTRPPPIDSIRVITEGKKNNLKTRGIQIASRISYEILRSYITSLSTV